MRLFNIVLQLYTLTLEFKPMTDVETCKRVTIHYIVHAVRQLNYSLKHLCLLQLLHKIVHIYLVPPVFSFPVKNCSHEAFTSSSFVNSLTSSQN